MVEVFVFSSSSFVVVGSLRDLSFLLSAVRNESAMVFQMTKKKKEGEEDKKRIKKQKEEEDKKRKKERGLEEGDDLV